jgi:hypothetical protein
MSKVLIEYVSVHNSADGNIDITRDGTRDVTVAWSVLAEPAGEEKNMLIAFLPSRVSLHHNLFIAAQQRNPQVTYDDSAARTRDTETTLDMRNNLLWNWRGGYGARIRYGARANVINNYFAAAGGDASDALVVCRGLANDSQCYDDTTNVARAFVSGNVSADGVNSTARGRRRRLSRPPRWIPTTRSSPRATSWPGPACAPSIRSMRRIWPWSGSPVARRRPRHPRIAPLSRRRAPTRAFAWTRSSRSTVRQASIRMAIRSRISGISGTERRW